MCSGTGNRFPVFELQSVGDALLPQESSKTRPKFIVEPHRPPQAGWWLSHLPGSTLCSCRAAWNRDKLQGSLGRETNSVSNHLSAGSPQVESLCQVSARFLAASPADDGWHRRGWSWTSLSTDVNGLHFCSEAQERLWAKQSLNCVLQNHAGRLAGSSHVRVLWRICYCKLFFHEGQIQTQGNAKKNPRCFTYLLKTYTVKKLYSKWIGKWQKPHILDTHFSQNTLLFFRIIMKGPSHRQ